MIKTYQDVKDEIKRIESIKVDGFDNKWVLHAAAREIALSDIEQIEPHTDKYNLIVRYLITGDESIRKEVHAAAYAVDADAYAADAAAARSSSYSNSVAILNRIADDYLALLDVPVRKVTQEEADDALLAHFGERVEVEG